MLHSIVICPGIYLENGAKASKIQLTIIEG